MLYDIMETLQRNRFFVRVMIPFLISYMFLGMGYIMYNSIQDRHRLGELLSETSGYLSRIESIVNTNSGRLEDAQADGARIIEILNVLLNNKQKQMIESQDESMRKIYFDEANQIASAIASSKDILGFYQEH